jgi:hypothetical protein
LIWAEKQEIAAADLASPFGCLTSAGDKVIYRRYASLFFIAGVSSGDNELVTLEVIHRYVEVLDRYFGNVRRPFPRSLDFRLSPS